MAISSTIQWVPVEELFLDPQNPRLASEFEGRTPGQEEILAIIKDWTLDELAVSFLESGFWPQEAMLVVKEQYQGAERLIVVEGNRRLAALKLLFRAAGGNPADRKWADIGRSASTPALERLHSVPILIADTRAEIQTFLGFRHVTGIKEWKPAEKARFISHLVDDLHMSYTDVMRRIGSKTPTVRGLYIAYHILRQMDDVEEIDLSAVGRKFSVLYLSLRTAGVQQYLGVDMKAEPLAAHTPVPPDRLANLARYAKWLFGSGDNSPIITDSRDVDRFGEVLESPTGRAYLERHESPQFSTAYRLSGGSERQVILILQRADDEIQQALSIVHQHRDSADVKVAVRQLGVDALEILSRFPEVRTELIQPPTPGGTPRA